MENIKQTKVCERDSPSSLHTIKTNKQQAKGAAFYKRKARADAHWRVFLAAQQEFVFPLSSSLSAARNGTAVQYRAKYRLVTKAGLCTFC